MRGLSRFASAVVVVFSVALSAAQAQTTPPVYPSDYPAAMPFYPLDPPTGNPVFLVGNGTYWNAFNSVATARNASNQQLAAAWVLYLHHVKGLQFVPQTTSTQVLQTRDIVVAAYQDSGLKALLDAQLAGQSLPSSVALDSWLNVTRRMTTLSGLQGPAKGHKCKTCSPGEGTSVYCPNVQFPCLDKCEGSGMGCYDLAGSIGSSAFLDLLTMNLP